jgi:hypothetical protein
MIVRKTYPELTENHIMPLVTMLNCYAPNRADRFASYNDSKKTITFPNGSRILFRYCENDKDAERFQGAEVDVLFIDEATHQSEDRMKKLTACVRGVNSFPKRIYMTANPGSEGHGWFKRLFIDRNYRKGENPNDYIFIQSKVTDNTALMKENPDYVSQLEALPPKLRKMWLEGDWNVAEGAFFEEFRDDPDHYDDHQYTHVINPFDIPKHWNIGMGFDFGYNKPFSAQYFAISPDGTVYNCLEVYGCLKDSNGEDIPNEGVKWTPQKIFSELHRIETTHPWLKGKTITRVADPACWNKESGESVAEVAAKNGVHLIRGNNDRVQGWINFHHYLHFDENGYSMLYIFKNCKSFIRTIPLQMYDEHRCEDLESSLEDHQVDSCRYFLQSRPLKPRIPQKPDEYINNPLNVYLNIPKENLKPLPKRQRMIIKED